jgi:ergothioneine biosynthesis protein EgtB
LKWPWPENWRKLRRKPRTHSSFAARGDGRCYAKIGGMKHPTLGITTREQLVAWYATVRERTRELFNLVAADAYHARPIALRNPLVFYEGHLPAFSINTLLKLGVGKPGIDEKLEVLFARGIDPADEQGVTNYDSLWPSREAVLDYGDRADALVRETLSTSPLVVDDVPSMRGGQAVFTILEHELMHQETLLYIIHQLEHTRKIARSPLTSGAPTTSLVREPNEPVAIPAGRVTLGATPDDAFGWDNEFPAHSVDVEAFSIDRHNVTNADFLEFMADGGYEQRELWSDEAWSGLAARDTRHPHFWRRHESGMWLWRGVFADAPLSMDAPVYVTHGEAEAFAKWRGGRLPTEAEYHRAAYGTPEGEERAHPWGDDAADATRGNFGFISWDPLPVGSFPAGASAWGVHDLVGNGWEWTSTRFNGFEGFEPMASYPQYSADFFDDEHFVMKGASPATASELVRRSFRNWFRPNYPYVYATFRVVR